MKKGNRNIMGMINMPVYEERIKLPSKEKMIRHLISALYLWEDIGRFVILALAYKEVK